MPSYPDYLSPNVTPTKKSRARREPSGVFSLFQPAQIQQFKEAFQLIDHDKDGWVTEKDLKEIFTSLGASTSHKIGSFAFTRHVRHNSHEADHGQLVERSSGRSQQVGIDCLHE